jgi:hypothetical protein
MSIRSSPQFRLGTPEGHPRSAATAVLTQAGTAGDAAPFEADDLVAVHDGDVPREVG